MSQKADRGGGRGRSARGNTGRMSIARPPEMAEVLATPPTTPEPPAGLIEAAKRDVANYLSRLPRPSADMNVSMNAQTLATGVRERLHCHQAAAEWAVFRLIGEGLLQVHKMLPEMLSNFVPLSRFIVSATEPFWQWWRESQVANVGESSSPRGSGRSLNATERAVLTIISKQHKGKGIQGKAIITALKKKGIDLKEESLRRHILPILIEHYHVQNIRAAGGYLIPVPEADAPPSR